MQVLAAFMAVVYPLGVPLAIFFMLWRVRDSLNPQRSAGEDEISVIEKLEKSTLYEDVPIAKFSQQLRPQFW